MKKNYQKYIYCAAGSLAAFVLWTAAVRVVDVRPIGPRGSAVGFASVNHLFHELTGVHLSLYTLTDWLSLVPIGFVIGFGVLGLMQWIQRKNLWKVDHSILALGGFYLVVMTVFLFFEFFAVNYRPVLIEGVLEVSYPSSTTMLVMCVMPTAVMQLNDRIRNRMHRKWISGVMIAFSVFMVAGRLISGVHWLTDIIGGGLISTGLVMTYAGIVAKMQRERP